jgi:hypothetical protein
VFGEDVEDKHRTIDDRHGDDLFEILALSRSKVVEDEYEIGVQLARAIGDLVRFSAADECSRIDVRAPLDDALDDLSARRFS